jgi:hypothetical protein
LKDAQTKVSRGDGDFATRSHLWYKKNMKKIRIGMTLPWSCQWKALKQATTYKHVFRGGVC